MKFISYEASGQARWGVVEGPSTITDLSAIAPTLMAALSTWSLEDLAAQVRNVPAQQKRLSLDAVKLLPVIPNPKRILCVGLNYDEHRIEANRAKTEKPTLFTRFASSQVAHGQPLIVPIESERFDYEGEIAIVIGKGGRRISEAAAWDHVAGYSAYNDGSVRDWQAHTTQWTAGKNFSGTGSFGPWLVSARSWRDGEPVTLETRLNGQVMQKGDTSQLIFPVPTLIAYISAFTPLEAGDVIVTGTPAGVGFKREPAVFMKDGDTVEVEVSGVGVLSNPVVAEAAMRLEKAA
ncbi:fumarylacetoacetate hydrolase family protein [soil metagenome]